MKSSSVFALLVRSFQAITVGSLLFVSTVAAAQTVSFSPTSLSWGNVAVGQTSGAKVVTVTNNQTGALTISAIALGSDFIQYATTCPTTPSTLAAGASCTISVQFRPLSQGTKTEAITVYDDASGSPQSVPLTGTAIIGPMLFSPTSLSFASVPAGTTSASQTATLTNELSTAITISGIKIWGQFAQTNNCPISPSTLASKASCTVTVESKPLTNGSTTGGVNVTDSSGGVELYLDSAESLTTSGGVSLGPSSYTFSTVAVGSSSAPYNFTLTNSQSTALTISSIGVSTTDFTETNTCGTSVAANTSCTISVTFAPQSSGTKSATLSVNDNATGSPQTSSLAGDAVTPTTQSLSFSPSSLSWGNVAVGQTSGAKSVTVTNTQSTALTFSSIAVGSDFVQNATTCPTSPSTLAGGASCTISVQFRPLSQGTKTESITFSDDGSGSPQSVPLSGTAIIGPMLFSPTSLSFASVPAGTTSASQTATLTNELSTAITISGVKVIGAFAQSNNCPISPSTLASKASCTFTVTSNPLTAGSTSGYVDVVDSSGSVALYLDGAGGTGSTTGAVVSPTSYSFPSEAVGSSSSPYQFTLANNQSVALTISSIAVSTTDFKETNTCGSSLAANASCTISVTFAPQSTGTKSATLSVSDNSSGSPQTASLTGDAVTSGTGVTMSPKSYTFPTTAIGTTSAPTTVTLTNNQSVALTISSIQLAAPFSQTNNCPGAGGPSGTLAAGASCTISITYSPTTVAYTTAYLTVTDNASNSPQSIPINGNSVAAISLNPKYGLVYTIQIVGRPSTPQTVTITNNESSSVTVNSIAIVGSAFSATNTCIPSGSSSGTLAAGASCTISVTFEPTTAGTNSGSITINNSAAGSPETLTLYGQGIYADSGINLVVDPLGPCMMPSQTLQFNADVVNTTDTAVTWYVDNIQGGNSTVGTISTGGLYRAPTTTGYHLIKAVSQAASTVSNVSKVTITDTPSFAIFPYTASMQVSTQQAFQGQICGVPDTNVTYSVDDINGGNAAVGYITSEGIYTAPSTTGKHTIRVTDPSLNKTSGAIATVYSNVSVDFGSRSDTTHPIPAELFGSNHADNLHNTADLGLVANSGLMVSRTYSNLPLVYATSTPDWTKIDPQIASLQAAGMHVILQMAYTPPWLQPSPNPCGSGNVNVTPTNVTQWGQLAASFVAHMDAKFPGVVQDYEIWNEPNASLCGNNKLNDYLSIYAAAAPLMKQQAATDGATIRVGGPTVSAGNPTWISALTTNTSTAPYVDFISYHDYIFGPQNINAQWSTYDGSMSLYQETQTIAASLYTSVSNLVKNGKQPLGALTPIYVDEYNTNYAFAQDCCRNDPTYSPVWNALYVSDLMNTVYNGTAAVPGKFVYYAASQYPYFCLIGTWDTHMDCQYSVGSTPVPYPQYYAYQLLSDSNYLGLENGGYMAASVTPSTSGGGLAVTAFYTTTQDAILIVNPTATAYSQMDVTMQNIGFTSTPQATLYQIVDGQSINTSSISLSTQNGGYTATVSVPANSVMAISIKGQ